VVAVLVVVLLVYPLALFAVAWTSLGRVDAFPASGALADTPGTNYLVVGSDSRADLTRAERARLGTGQAAGQRTDTIMLLHVPSGSGPTVLVSVPRDSYVAIPGHGKNKINAAYAFGGPQLLVRTVEQATGVHLDEYVETGLGGYASLVDAVGGVQVCVKTAIKDAKAHIDVPKGCQTFDGKTALGYARARYSDPRGDLGRVERQRQVLAAIAGKTLSPSVVLEPWRAFPAASAGGHALTVDSGTSPLGLGRFVLAMRSVAGGGGLSLTVPIGNSALQTSNAGEAVSWDTAQAATLFTALRTDDTEAIRPLVAAQKAN
jgi:LCP family protein required for cell wall assembly